MNRVFGPYLSFTSSLKYSFLMSLPLLIGYEVLIRLSGVMGTPDVRLAADLWIQNLIAAAGIPTWYVTVAVIVVLGIYVFSKDRKNPVPMHGKFCMGMVVESAVWAFFLAWTVSRATGWMFNAAADGMASLTVLQQFALSLGAGLYEELVFRVILVSALTALFAKLGFGPRGKQVAAVFLAAALFSAVHYMGALGDPFTLSSFTFRFLFGLALNALYVMRGFGIAAWTHSLYDVFVILNNG